MALTSNRLQTRLAAYLPLPQRSPFPPHKSRNTRLRLTISLIFRRRWLRHRLHVSDHCLRPSTDTPRSWRFSPAGFSTTNVYDTPILAFPHTHPCRGPPSVPRDVAPYVAFRRRLPLHPLSLLLPTPITGSNTLSSTTYTFITTTAVATTSAQPTPPVHSTSRFLLKLLPFRLPLDLPVPSSLRPCCATRITDDLGLAI